jgi:hypothetical protein
MWIFGGLLWLVLIGLGVYHISKGSKEIGIFIIFIVIFSLLLTLSSIFEWRI